MSVQYCEVKRRAQAGERIKVVAASGTFDMYGNGDIFVVDRASDYRGVEVDAVKTQDSGNDEGFIRHNEYVVLEPVESVEPAPEPDRITDLERQIDAQAAHIDGLTETVAKLTLKVAYLEREVPRKWADVRREPAMPNAESDRVPRVGDRVIIVDQCATNIGDASPNLINGEERLVLRIDDSNDYPYSIGPDDDHGIWSARSAFRFADEDTAAESELTRDEIIERAKRDVAELTREHRDVYGDHPHFWPQIDGECTRWTPIQRVEFVVNREKRAVVALIRFLPRFQGGRVWAKGIAKCAPDDVFNVSLGKAIALRRALGLDVPDEYLRLPKPTVLRAGAVVSTCRIPGGYTLRTDWTYAGIMKQPDILAILDDSCEEETE